MRMARQSDVAWKRLQGALVARLGNGEDVFVKAQVGLEAWLGANKRYPFSRERACLQTLEGLAVPELKRIDPSRIRGWPFSPGFPYLAMEYVPGKIFCLPGPTPMEKLGAWIFVLEQFVAFRRHELLYADVKCGNILIRTRPIGVRIIDFGGVVALADFNGKRGPLPFTAGFQAPEQLEPTRGSSEKILVYQTALLLGCGLIRSFNRHLAYYPRKGIQGLRRALKEMKAEPLAGVVAQCLDADPKSRPARDYEELFELVNAAGFPAEARAVWQRLRAPYKERLAEVAL